MEITCHMQIGFDSLVRLADGSLIERSILIEKKKQKDRLMANKPTFFIKLLKVHRANTPFLIPGRKTEIRTITDTKFEKEEVTVRTTVLYDGRIAEESISIYPYRNLSKLQTLHEGTQESIEIRQDHQEMYSMSDSPHYDKDTELECYYCGHKFPLKDLKQESGVDAWDANCDWYIAAPDKDDICPNCNLADCCVLEYETIEQYNNRVNK